MEVTLRVLLLAPPAGVRFALQRGSDEIVDAVESDGHDLTFELSIRVKETPDGAPDFGGPFVQGPARGRFVYVSSGVRAGDTASTWDRRAKVPLTGITRDMVEQAVELGGCLAASIPGKAKDGGPVCASVQPLGGGWLVQAR